MIKYFLITLLIASLFVSCVEPFHIETNDSPPAIVIYGYLTNEFAFHAIKVSSSSPYFDRSFNRGIAGAKVKITSSGNNVLHFREIDSIPGLYLTAQRIAGVPGTTYSLSVEVDFDNDGDTELYSATSTMPNAVEVDSIQVKNMEMMGYRFYSFNLYAQDSPAEDYYLGKYNINDSVVMFNINQLSPMSDIAFNGQYINGMMIQRFWDIDEKEKIEKNDDDDDDDRERRRVYLAVGDTVAFSLCHIEKGYYDFIVQCQDEMSGENPFFGGPASNIVTNISNGGFGYFTAYAGYTVKTMVKKNDD
jgi:hypothetical protein